MALLRINTRLFVSRLPTLTCLNSCGQNDAFYSGESSILNQYSAVDRTRYYSLLSRHSKQIHGVNEWTRNIQNHIHSRKMASLSLKSIMESASPGVKSYLNLIRFDRPIGSWLLYMPCLWSIGLASTPGCLPDVYTLALFGAGSFLMRGAGCIINDLADRRFDKKVKRTKDRPLASGALTPAQAVAYLAGNLSLSLIVLLQLNWYSIFLASSALSLVCIYPFAKRFTYWPQAVLGLTFNWGALVGYSAVRGACDWTVVGPLYLSCVMWTMIYDTIYAHQDKDDDISIGVKSTALRFGDQTKYWLTGFHGLMISGLTLTGVMADQTWPYYMGVGYVAAHIARQIYTVDIDDGDDCAAKFRSNKNLGLVFFLFIVAGTLLKTSSDRQSQHSESESQSTNPES